MTNEQAIKWLKEALKTTDFQYEQMEKAVEMAIQALEQEPCDAISRQAVLDGIAEWIVDGYADSEADCSHISSLVTHLPSVRPQEPKTDVLSKIRAEIERPLRIERYADTESAKAQAIALSWCLEIIDKYREGGE